MGFPEHVKTKLLCNACDLFAWAAMHLIVAVALIAWVAGNGALRMVTFLQLADRRCGVD